MSNQEQQYITYPERTGVPKYILYTDGGCLNNGYPNAYGAWAFILDGNNRLERDSAGFTTYNGKPATNNKAEMLAIINGLRRIEPGSDVDIVTDSEVMISWIERWQAKFRKKHAMDKDLINEFISVATGKNLKATWVKGHNGHTQNEWCDQECEKIMNGLLIQ